MSLLRLFVQIEFNVEICQNLDCFVLLLQIKFVIIYEINETVIK